MVLIETENQNKIAILKSAKLVALCENYNLQDINQRFQSFKVAVSWLRLMETKNQGFLPRKKNNQCIDRERVKTF